MLTKTQRQYLKGLANTLKPLVQIGKSGLNENIIVSVDEVLEAHELCKISILNTCPQETGEIALDLSSATNSDIVSQLGRKIVLFRRNLKKGTITLPK
ncbi:MAG: YhbY family RNA-binding protein [Erysipelotrichaceae bacterium]|nr:YhbY family RNA-binding protein [Erysipelotrichaceae bacterium]MBQ1521144.1 YhbY family RNA-binding protein [Erysipelotrichaceae bacterium]MBQ1757969.1 YhbY family RNA-binding protein [Erysipelotrichaceae bacterium]MBR2791859.1 YhbY family RNA-binding protein [Erysipelotrichaceae bacterium]